jgi:hypothetical protein
MMSFLAEAAARHQNVNISVRPKHLWLAACGDKEGGAVYVHRALDWGGLEAAVDPGNLIDVEVASMAAEILAFDPHGG